MDSAVEMSSEFGALGLGRAFSARNQLKAIEARRRPPDLHEVWTSLSPEGF